MNKHVKVVLVWIAACSLSFGCGALFAPISPYIGMVIGICLGYLAGTYTFEEYFE